MPKRNCANCARRTPHAAHRRYPTNAPTPSIGWGEQGAAAIAASIPVMRVRSSSGARSIVAAPAGAEGLLFLPYLAGERSPIWDPTARGVLAGLTLRHGRGHLFRAAYEGIAFGIRQILDRFDDATRVRRLTGMLARKGYPSSVVFRVVREEVAAAEELLDPDL